MAYTNLAYPQWPKNGLHLLGIKFPIKSIGPIGQATLNPSCGAPVLYGLARHWLPILWEGCCTPNLGHRIQMWKNNNFKKVCKMLKTNILHSLHPPWTVSCRALDWWRAFCWGRLAFPCQWSLAKLLQITANLNINPMYIKTPPAIPPNVKVHRYSKWNKMSCPINRNYDPSSQLPNFP